MAFRVTSSLLEKDQTRNFTIDTNTAYDLLSSLFTLVTEKVVQSLGLGAGREKLFLGERFSREELNRMRKNRKL